MVETNKFTIERVTYHSEETGYSVLRCANKKYGATTVVGSFASPIPGGEIEVEGYWKVHPKYGDQFVSERYRETLPTSPDGIRKFLEGGFIKGIGTVYAKNIVDHFGEKTFDVIENNPERLLEVSGIGEGRLKKIKTSWVSAKHIRDVAMFLGKYNISQTFASRIYKEYGEKSISVINENPYRLADDIWGIGFKTADALGQKLGYSKDRYERIRAGIKYTLNQLSDIGHCYATEEQLVDFSQEILEVSPSLINLAVRRMVVEEELLFDEGAYYLKPFFFAEWGVAKRLDTIMKGEHQRRLFPERLIEILEEQAGIRYDETQKDAILTAIRSKVFVITGGPGTGKTTITAGIVGAFRISGADVVLAAPTGRAAKRMQETIGLEAKTIHRLLEFSPSGFQRNEENPLSGDVLILDECSMIDLHLMNNLLKAIPDTMTVILIGDIDQLPSVGAGNVLKDIIDSECVPVARLKTIFRQSNESWIVKMAHQVNNGKMPYSGNKDYSDFFFYKTDKDMEKEEIPEYVQGMVLDLVCNHLPNVYGCDPKEVQVLVPTQRGQVGVAVLNKLLQERLNPTGKSLSFGSITFRAGDKIMQIKNNYEKDVFNGDIGEVERIDLEDKTLVARYSDSNKTVEYDVTELDEVKLAYATTIHKAQGSEFPYVVMPVTFGHYMLLQRNLLYTGITRAKDKLYLVGEARAVYRAVTNEDTSKRNTKLMERIRYLA